MAYDPDILQKPDIGKLILRLVLVTLAAGMVKAIIGW